MFDTFVIDDGSPGALALSTNADPYQVTAWSSPLPEQRIVAAEVHEGELLLEDGYRNRELTMTVVVVGATHEDMNDRLAALLERVGKLQREKGRIGWQRTGCEPVWFDVETAATPGVTFDLPHYIAKLGTVELKFTCKPFLRGVERLLGSGTRLAGQRLLTIPDLEVPGDVPALARLEFSGASVPQQTLLYAIDQPDAASLATGVQVAATSLYSLGVTATQVGSLSPNIKRIGAVPAGVPSGMWQPCLYLHDTGGTPVALTGTYRVRARVSCARSGPLTLRLRWSAGRDPVALSENPWWQSAAADWWEWADLGTVTIPSGSDGLDGVIERVTPYGSDTHFDLLLFVPTDRNGAAYAAPTELGSTVAADSMAGAGNLAGSAPPIGAASWIGSSSPVAFVRNGTGARRTTTSGSQNVSLNLWSFPLAARVSASAMVGGTTSPALGTYSLWAANYDGQQFMNGGSYSASNIWLARIMPSLTSGSGWQRHYLFLYVGSTTYKEYVVPGSFLSFASTMSLDVRPDLGTVSLTTTNSLGQSFGSGPIDAQTPALGAMYIGITGAALPSSPTAYVEFSNLTLQQIQTADSALYPSKTANISSTGAYRQGATAGTKALALERDWPLLPPTGRDGRLARVVMGTARDDLRGFVDSVPTDLFTGTVYATPRYLQLPDSDSSGMLLPSDLLLPSDDLLPEGP